MPRRAGKSAAVIQQPPPMRSWFLNQISLGNIIAIIGIIGGGFTFYFTTKSDISVNAQAVVRLEQKVLEVEKQNKEDRTQQITEREKLRESISNLSEKTAVLSSQLTTITSEIVKLGTKIETVGNSSRR